MNNKFVETKHQRFFMRSGGCIDFSKERLDFFPLGDILISLAKEDRYFNQVDWSVLEHLLACGMACETLYENRLLIRHTYVHDFSEAFLRDIPGMVKTDEYRAIERNVSEKLYAYIGLDPLSIEDEAMLKNIDIHMRLVESFHLYDTQECYEAIKEDFKVIDPDVLLACSEAFLTIHGMQVFDESGALNPVIFQTYENVFRRFE